MSKKPKGPFSALEKLRDKVGTEPAKPAPAPPPRATKSEEEDALLRLRSGVRPLGDRKHTGPALPEELPPSEMAARERLADLAMGEARFEVQDDGVHVEGRRLDVGAEVLRRLRRGGMPIDARLDLHERTVEQAKDELVKFLGAMRARGERCVLVIHGKGEHSPGGVGILRGEVGAWLSQGRAAMHVAAFVTATATDGGSGATYVLLRNAGGAR